MDIQAEKLDLIKWITQLNDLKVINEIKALRKENADWWDELSIEERSEVELGLEQADQGKVKPHEEVMSKYSKWL
jgi:hypothetical protein